MALVLDGLLTGFLLPGAVFGTGLGISAVAALAASTHDLGEEGESGLASGLVNTTQQVGGAVGMAVLSTFAFGRSDHLLATGAAFPLALLDGLILSMRIGAVIALAGAVLASMAFSRGTGGSSDAPHRGTFQ